MKTKSVIVNRTFFLLVFAFFLVLFSYAIYAFATGGISFASYDKWDGVTVAEEFASGNGTKENPYLIQTPAEFVYFQSLLEGENSEAYADKYYALGDDIDFNDHTLKPIGSYFVHEDESKEEKVFKGEFDGRGYTLRNFKITEAKTFGEVKYYSLFTKVIEGSIVRVNLDHFKIDTVEDNDAVISGLVGTIQKGSLENVVIRNFEIDSKKSENSKISLIANGSDEETTFKNITILGKVNGEGDITFFENGKAENILSGVQYEGTIVDSEKYYVLKDNKIYLGEEEISIEGYLASLNEGLEDVYEWKIENDEFIFYTHELDKKEEEEEVEEVDESSKGFSFSITKAPAISLHDSGIDGTNIYINDLTSDYNYYIGRNYTEITNSTGTIPDGTDRGLYSNSNLATVYIRYNSRDINDNNVYGTVSTAETFTDYYYYKRYPVVDGYVEFDLIDNPWANRPDGRAFNGWVTDYTGAVISYNRSNYTRRVKIPVNNVSQPISITFNASWTLATTVTSTNDIRNLLNAGMHELPKVATVDLRNYWIQRHIDRYDDYPNSNNLYSLNGNKINPGAYCNTSGGCTFIDKVTDNTYSDDASYYSVQTNVTPAVLTRYYPPLKSIPYYNNGGVAAGYFKKVTDGDNLYDANGNKINYCSGDCYQLLQYSDGAIDNNTTYYYLTTRDTNIFAPSGNIDADDITTNRPMTITGINGGENHSGRRIEISYYNWTINSDLRIEYITLYTDYDDQNVSNIPTSNSLLGNFHNLKVGRGINRYGDRLTAATISGGSNNDTGTGTLTSYSLIVESGYYAVGSGVGFYAGYAHHVDARVTLGNDLDRIRTANNNRLTIYYNYAGSWGSYLYSGTANSNTYDKPAIHTIIKSGVYGANEADFAAGVYIGGLMAGNHYAMRELTVEGGVIYNILGGPLSDSSRASKNDIILNVKGGTIDYIFTGAGVSNTVGNKIINITGGTIEYSVLGGSNAYSTSGGNYSNPYGRVDGNTLLYVGGNVKVGTQTDSRYNVPAGNVFGAGNGRSGEEKVGSVNNSTIIIGPDANITGNVFGGGNFGAVGGNLAGNTNANSNTNTELDLYEDGTADNNIRYYGANPENYISFNNQTYRIVGLFNNVNTPDGQKNLVRIMANRRYNSGGNTHAWMADNAHYRPNNTTHYYYNYFTKTDNTRSEMYNYLNTTFYNSLNATYRNYIQTATWGLGATENYDLTAGGFYNAERGGTPSHVDSASSASFNVGLFYASDFGFASSGSGCLTTNLYNYNGGCYNSNWIRNVVTNNAWTLSLSTATSNTSSGGGFFNPRTYYYGYRIFNLNGNRINYVSVNTGNTNKNTLSVYPSFYLKDNVKISGGTGTSDDPYIIGDGDKTLAEIIYKKMYPDPIDDPDDPSNAEDDGEYEEATDYQTRTNIHIIGGTINGDVYGAGNRNGSGNLTGGKIAVSKITITMDSGTVKGSVYGGSNEQGVVYGDILINVNNGAINQSVYGGGKGGYDSATSPGTYVMRDIDVNIGSDSTTALTISQNVYGGSAFGSVGGTSQDDDPNSNHVRVKVNNGTISGDVFGGGQGDNTHNPKEFGNVFVHINGGNISRVFGGNDSAGQPSAGDVVYLNGGVIGNAFGGGNNTGQDLTDIRLQGATITANLYGGSNQSGTVKTSRVGVTSGSVVNVFGGNNLDGSTLATNVGITGGTISGDIYGGGNEAESNSTSVIIYNGEFNNVYGGGNEAGVSGSTNVSVLNGRIDNIFGGSNNSGDVGDTHINIVDSYEEFTVIREVDTDLQLVNNGAHWDNNGVRRLTIAPIIKNLSDHDYTEWTATITIPNSTFFREYLNSPLVVDGETYTFSHVNKYDANIPFVVPAHGEREIPGYFEVFVPIQDSYEIDFRIDAKNDVGGTTSYSGTYLDGVRIPDGIKKGINHIYGGNNLGGSTNSSTINVTAGNIGEIFGGGNQVGVTTTNINAKGGEIESVFGGSNQLGDVTTSNVNIGNGDPANVQITSVYGGNNKGGVTSQANVTLTAGSVETIFGGGNEASVTNTKVTVNGGTAMDVYGGGNAASVQQNTILDINGGTVTHNAYGGGNEGTVQQNTNVTITDGAVQGNAFAGGNGATAIVHGNSTITVDGNAVIGTGSVPAPDAGCVFGSGNAAATGLTNGNSKATVNIVGGEIYGNVYGGAKMSVVYGTTETNIGTAASTVNGLTESDIKIHGTVFGGGESNASGSESYDYTFISVTQGITVNIDGTGYIDHDHDFIIEGSIFGSGNASSSNGESNINIKHLGSRTKPNKAISIQRASNLVIDSSVVELIGTTDRTNEHSEIEYSLNLIDKMVIKNGTVLFLQHNANKLKEFYSGVDVGGNLQPAVVTIDENSGSITKNVDNRLYMKAKENLNVALDKDATAYGRVTGMTFFGMYLPSDDGNRLGLYDYQYNNGDTGDASLIIAGGSYVVGLRLSNHDITKDGFYTNTLDEETYTNITTNYINPTEIGEEGYRWIVGYDAIEYEITLEISKYASLGTKNLKLDKIAKADTIYDVLSVDATGFDPDTEIVDSDAIPRVADTDEEANEKIGLAMKVETSEWVNFGTTKILSENGGKFKGDKTYITDSRNLAQSLMFYTYHSKNYNRVGELGKVVLTLQAAVPRNAIEYDITFVNITINIVAKSADEDPAYDASITYSKKYEMPADTLVNITNQSQFTAYFALNDKYNNFGAVYGVGNVNYHVLTFSKPLPVGTIITMLDFGANDNRPDYYYFTIDQATYNASVQQYNVDNEVAYRLSNFIRMDSTSTNNLYNDAIANQQYYNVDTNMVDEEFIFIVDMKDSTQTGTHLNTRVSFELRNTDDWPVVNVVSFRNDVMYYNTYDSSNIVLSQTITDQDEYLYANVADNFHYATKILYNETENRQSVIDTNYEYSNMGLNVSLFTSSGSLVSSSLLAGTNITIGTQEYYADGEGIFRIKLASKVSTIEREAKLVPGAVLPEGQYTIRYTLFASEDGLHNSDAKNSVSKEINVKVVAAGSFIAAECDDEAKLVYGETGLNHGGTRVNTYTVKYNSLVSNPNYRVEILKRVTTDANTLAYQPVHFNQLFTNEFTSVGEYEVSLPITEEGEQSFDFTLAENLTSGTYRVVFKLYDQNQIIDEDIKYVIVQKKID